MVPRLRMLLIGGVLAAVTQGAERTRAAGPHWLAVHDFAAGDRLSCSLTVPAVQSATLRFSGDFCRTYILFNGATIADVEPYCQTQTFDVTDAIRLGENQVELIPEPISDAPTIVAMELTMLMADGSRTSLRTGHEWMVKTASGRTKAATSRGLVPPELWGLERRPISIDPFENYEQWQQAKGGNGQSPRFFVARGFEITQLRVAEPGEGSWVSLAFDARGRLTIGREDQGFLRMTIADDARSVTWVESLELDLRECRGLVYHDDWLYASANNSKTLYRLKPGDDGRIADLTALREFPGDVGHGRNDLALLGDSLYLICGDSVDLPTTDVLDHTSPLRKLVAGSFTREGSLLRSSLDGRRWELLCGGLRNPYGVAIHPEYGDAFTYDADNEYDLGMPWYRPTRVLQLVPGADYGYREATSQLPPRFSDQADNAPPLFEIGRGSPTAVVFGNSFQFPRSYRDAFFVLDWTYGRVIAVHLAPRGASYRASAELFLQGKPLNVTDVAAGPDGAMYLITGGRQTQSALYRVAPTTPSSSIANGAEAAESAIQKEFREYARRNRDIAYSLESHDPKGASAALDRILPFLEDADPILRYKARTALEKAAASTSGSAVWSAAAAARSVHGLLAVARALDPKWVPTIVDRLVSIPLESLSIGRRLAWLRTLELCIAADRQAVFGRRAPLEEQLVAGWRASGSPVRQVSVEGTNADYRRRAALLLHSLDSAQLPSLAARDLLSSPSQEDRIAALMALRNHRGGWVPDARERQLQALAAMPQMLGGEGLPAFHAWLERETRATLAPEEQARYAALKTANTQSEPLPPARPFVRKWSLDELREVALNPQAGDARRGELVFRDALCVRCHRFGRNGAAVGPDLTFVGGRFSRHDILDSILNPSKAVAENYRSVTVQTTDGQVVTGRLVGGGDFRSERIRLVPDSLRPDQVVELDKQSIEDHWPSDASPMPQGLLDTWARDDIADLLAYLTGRTN